jgi:WD40 repeat protein
VILAIPLLVVPSSTSAAYTRLAIQEPRDMVVDAAHEQVFITGGPDDQAILVASYDAEIVDRINGERGASYMELAGDRLYVSFPADHEVHVFDTTTLERVETISTGADSYPGPLALSGDYLWFGTCTDTPQNVGSVHLATGLVQKSDGPGIGCVALEAVPGSDSQIVAYDLSTHGQSFPITFYDVAAGRLLRARGTVEGGADVRFTADGASFATCVGSHRVQRFQTTDLAPLDGPRPRCLSALDLSADGRSIAATAGYDVYVHREGSPPAVRRVESATIVPRGLKMTPDGKRLFALTYRPQYPLPDHELSVFVPATRALRSRAFEYRPSGDGSYLMWSERTRYKAADTTVFVSKAGGRRIRVNAKGTEGFSGGIDGSRLVYQQARRLKSDIMFYDLARNKRRPVSRKVNSRLWEYYPSVSGPWLLFGRVNLRATDRRVMLANLETGRVTTIDRMRGRRSYLVPGQMNGRYATWVKCTSRCDIYRYDASTRKKIRVPNPNIVDLFGPSVTADGTVYFGRSSGKCGRDIRLVKYEDGKVSVVMDLAPGHDFFTSFVFERDGKTGLYFDMLECPGFEELQSDVYLIDDL